MGRLFVLLCVFSFFLFPFLWWGSSEPPTSTGTFEDLQGTKSFVHPLLSPDRFNVLVARARDEITRAGSDAALMRLAPGNLGWPTDRP